MIASATPVSRPKTTTRQGLPAAAFRTPAVSRPRAPLLSALCADLPVLSVKGVMDRAITGLCADSRQARRGVLFFALPGDLTDGSLYIEEAIDRGAAAVVTERVRYWHPDVTFIQVADVREAVADLSSRFHGYPAGAMDIVGVTGSAGKTAVAHLLHHALDEEPNTGLISTNRYLFGERTAPSARTTPEAIDLHGMLAEMRAAGCERAVIEASSIGAARKSLDGLPLKVAVFLNVNRDDARRHGGEENCFSVYRALFNGETAPPPEAAVINLDDPWGRELIQELPEEVTAITFGESSHATVNAEEVESGPDGLILRVNWPEGSPKVRSPLVGRFQVSNLLAASAAAYAMGLDLDRVLPRIAAYPGTEGRMERIDCGQPFTVLVDYAHTPETIRAMLRGARETGFGRVLTVAGCGGGSDRAGRAFFMESVQEGSDFVWATSDNPRMEPMEQIFADMRRGVVDPQRIVFVESREKAIASALETASPGDVVVIAGKGHEAFQEIGGRLHPFDDRQIVRELIANLSFPVS